MSTVLTTDNIQRVLGTVWNSFPSVFKHPTDKTGLITIVQPLMKNSEEFCTGVEKRINKKKLEISFKTRGGRGAVGPLYMDEGRYKEKILMTGISLSSKGPWFPTLTECYIKMLLDDEELLLEIDEEGKNTTYTSNEGLHEIIISSMASHLVDIGLGPALTKYFGGYICSSSDYYILFERNHFDLFSLLNGGESWERHPDRKVIYDMMMPEDMYIWIAHLAIQNYINKYCFGLVHLDLHLRNVMLKYVGSSGFNFHHGNPKMPTYLQAKDLSTVGYIEYILPFEHKGKKTVLVIENNGFMPHIIDWGLSLVDFSISTENSHLPFKFYPETTYYNEEALKHPNTYGDIEYNFFMYNLIFHLERQMLFSKQKKVIKPLLEKMNVWANETVEDWDPYQKKKIKGKLKPMFWRLKDKEPFIFVTGVLDVGTTDNIMTPITNIMNLLIRQKKFVQTEEAFIFYLTRHGKPDFMDKPMVTVDITKFSKTRDDLGTFLNESKTFFDECVIHDSHSEHCKLTGQDVDKRNPNESLTPSLFRYSIPKNSKMWAKNDNLKTITHSMLKKEADTFLEKSISSFVQSYQIDFEPYRYPNLKLPNNEKLVYLNTQRLVNWSSPPKQLINKPLSTVHSHFIYLDTPKDVIGYTEDDLYTASIEVLGKKRGISINGPYFIVTGNVENPLTSFLKEDDIFRPVGYYYNVDEKKESGTLLPVPYPYKKDFASIYVDSSNKIHFMKNNEFLKHHKTQLGSSLVYLCDKNRSVFKKGQKDVVARIDTPEIKLNKKGEPETDLDYKLAFQSGPILIWDGKLVFTRKKMLEEKLFLDHSIIGRTKLAPWKLHKELVMATQSDIKKATHYLLDKNDQTVEAYNNKEGETKFIYGQRASPNLNIFSALCETNDGETMIALVEGRGYTAPGLDRAQFASLLVTMNVKHAVCLDGGFSANVIFKDKERSWMLNDPEKRQLGLSLHFIY
jgi:hypothetical protein